MSEQTQREILRFTLPAETAGSRLDAALASAFPDLGLRGRRRLWLHCRILLNGRERGPAHKVSGGESVTFIPLRERPHTLPAGGNIRLVACSASYVALFKPAGLHTAALAGSPEASLEGLLPSVWEEWRLANPNLPPSAPLLLSRLDAPTSGLIVAAFDADTAEAFRRQEAVGEIRKLYLALVHGRIETPLALTRALDTADRKKTRVLADADPDPARHTLVEPIRRLERPGGPATLVRVLIRRGARHQIRAHLAAAGHPLVGDTLYDGAGRPEEFLLRHYSLELPGFSAELED